MHHGLSYAPVSRIPSVCVSLAIIIAASHNCDAIELDVQTAFLQSEMKEAKKKGM